MGFENIAAHVNGQQSNTPTRIVGYAWQRVYGSLVHFLHRPNPGGVNSPWGSPMSRRLTISLSLAVLSLFPPVVPLLVAQLNHEKNAWNYDGGLQMMTDGQISSGPCFSISGRVTAPHYFEGLKRVDTKAGTPIHRGNHPVTQFPETLHLSFLLYDLPCTDQIQNASTRTYLTNALVSTLRLSFYWKRGMEMRPANGVVPKLFGTRRITPYAKKLATQPPERFGWEFEFDLSSAGVPVTDSLVIILRTPDGHIAARGAARM
jgi:hypothetical protein